MFPQMIDFFHKIWYYDNRSVFLNKSNQKQVDFLAFLLCLLINNSKNFMTGTIKKIVSEKAFGFIAVEGMEKDLFFHMNSCVGVSFEDLREGDTVSFEVEDSPKGKNAVNVQKA